ncbi:transcription factor IIIA-like isoform X2 [Sinocyclocheilus anshuiensis]|uniref:transcription factor IIIA-like isoform X2 n=1 Tax=Sinocyclocheilus anshuiensis TaxID=1608454 RepID=UPI0007B9FF67|nr:PREDICTED: transcription factor IIIA-like isoform X2 [Sinocyclocheilus anshuiensis]
MGERIKHPNKHLICSFADCKATFSKLWKLEAHYCRHTGLPFVCGDCEKSFCTRYQLTRHQLSHSGEKPYLCSVTGCSDAFSTPGSLRNHVAHAHHQKESYYVCNHEGCGKEFRKKKQLKIHICEHTNELPFECDFEGCNDKFASSKALKRHWKMHEGYPCGEEYCNFKGKTWSEYQKHKKTAHRVTLPCDQCKKMFQNAWFLEKHKQSVHSGQRCMFKCAREGCEKSYTTNFNLQNHILVFHEGKCDFACPFAGCGKAFAMEESLKRHFVVHKPQKTKLQKPKIKQRKRKKTPSKTKLSDATKLSKHLQNVSLNKTASKKQLP